MFASLLPSPWNSTEMPGEAKRGADVLLAVDDAIVPSLLTRGRRGSEKVDG